MIAQKHFETINNNTSDQAINFNSKAQPGCSYMQERNERFTD